MKLRAVHLAGFPAAVAIGAGCGTVLVLEESPTADAGVEGGSTGTAVIDEAGVPVVPNLSDASCNEAFCAQHQGSCDSGACRIRCTPETCPKEGTIECPLGTDCQLVCPKDQCDHLQCRGGRCTFECTADSACEEAACSGEQCLFRCSAKGSCADNLFCDGGTCGAECSGDESCVSDDGITFEAAKTCAILCTGNKACSHGDHPELRCGTSPESTIICAEGACKDGIPTCAPPTGGSCRIDCAPESCSRGICCSSPTGCNLVGATNCL